MEPLVPPQPNWETAPFWEATRRGALVVQRCAQCGAHQFYPRALCTSCGAPDPAWVDASGRGRLHAWSVVHRAPGPQFRERVPYVVALVDLDEGPRLMTHLVDADPEALRAELPVQVRFDGPSGEIRVPLFVPAGGGDR